ncbi:hypothetical protein [Algisphaera agarilytica]|uniref:Uncharacterized protein n=1 Tax=Algisphaera agarilytica TaxID=1385975 RepID=A0A7X0H4X0_9BACT|nr:hypothetical protein [Algisphaera agarilytica]MBB6429290.1 hypothetical protein [Algisphaera agarilytica]
MATAERHPRTRGAASLLLMAALGLSWAGSGCTTAGRLSSLLPDEVAEPMEEVLPIGIAETLAVLEPFSIVRRLDQGLTYIEIDEQTHRVRGAWFSVNQGPWTTAATLNRGDQVDVTYTRENSAGTTSYVFYGPTTGGFIRMVETRWYYDGYPEERRSLRVRPYEIQRQAFVSR